MNKIYLGHVMDKIKLIPDNSVHTIVTSIPYWGLRNYNTEPQIWPDERLPLCSDHTWLDCSPRRNRSSNDVVNADSIQKLNKDSMYNASGGMVCQKCKAWKGELGLEPTIGLFVIHIVQIFREVRRVLRKDGTLWLNIGDTYNSVPGSKSFKRDRAEVYVKGRRIQRGGGRWGGGNANDAKLKPKDLCMIPARVAIALQADGWYLRSDIIWSKPNPMPESVTDRPSKSHEYIFLLTKSKKYFYDGEAIKEPIDEKTIERANGNWNTNEKSKSEAYVESGAYTRSAKKINQELAEKIKSGQNLTRNKRTVWTVTTEAVKENHFATFPQKLVEPCIRAGTSEKGCCAKCGAPYERTLKKSGGTIGKSFHDHADDLGKGMSQVNSKKMKDGTYKVATVGWKKTCKCKTKELTRPIVFDPFGGVLTTAIVASGLTRNWIMIELNPQSVQDGRKRLYRKVGFLSDHELIK